MKGVADLTGDQPGSQSRCVVASDMRPTLTPAIFLRRRRVDDRTVDSRQGTMDGLLEVRAKVVSYLVGSTDVEFLHRAPIRPAFWPGPRNMEVHVRHRLVGGEAVVLPDGDALWIESAGDGLRGTHHATHERALLSERQLEHRDTVLDRDDQDVTSSPLFICDEGRGELIAMENGVGTGTGEVFAERARLRWRQEEGHRRSLTAGSTAPAGDEVAALEMLADEDREDSARSMSAEPGGDRFPAKRHPAFGDADVVIRERRG